MSLHIWQYYHVLWSSHSHRALLYLRQLPGTFQYWPASDLYQTTNLLVVFVLISLWPSQQLFSPVGTISCLSPCLKQYKAVDKAACSSTQCSALKSIKQHTPTWHKIRPHLLIRHFEKYSLTLRSYFVLWFSNINLNRFRNINLNHNFEMPAFSDITSLVKV